MNAKFKSIKYIINKILSNPLMENINPSDLAQYVGDVLRLIGAPKSFVDESCVINIKDYRGKLPKNMLYIIQCLYKGNDEKYYAMKYASSTMQSQYHILGSSDFNYNSEHTYSLNNDYIFFDQEEGEIKMVYKAIKVDAEGFPMIPDNVQTEKAIENYIKVQHYTILWELGKIPDKVLQRVEQEYGWYVGAAQSQANAMTIDEAEAFSNAFSKLLLKPLQHDEFFVNHGARQYLKNNRI